MIHINKKISIAKFFQVELNNIWFNNPAYSKLYRADAILNNIKTSKGLREARKSGSRKLLESVIQQEYDKASKKAKAAGW